MLKWDSYAVWTVLIWQYLKWTLISLSDITQESAAAQTDHYLDIFVRDGVTRLMMLQRRYDVWKFNSGAILFGENQCKKNGILRFSVFFVGFWLESGQICKNNNHTCLFHCINTCQVPWEMFEHLAWQPLIQTASSGPDKCLCMKKHVWSLFSLCMSSDFIGTFYRLIWESFPIQKWSLFSQFHVF